MKSNGEFEYGDKVRLKVQYPRLSIPNGIFQHSVGTIISKDPSAMACYLVNFSEIISSATSVTVSYYDIAYKRPDKIGKGFRQVICQLTTLERHYKKINKNGRL